MACSNESGRILRRQAGALLAVGVVLIASQTGAAEVDRALLVPAVEAAVAGGVAEAQALMTCAAADAGPEAAESIRETWSEERDMIVATLWATGFPEEKIRAVEAKSDPANLTPSPRTTEECREIMRRHPLPEDTRPHRRVWRTIATAGIDFGAIKPAKKRTLGIVEAAFSEVLPRQALALRCLSFADTTVFEWTASAWREQIAEIRRSLRAAGWPRDIVDKFTLPADVDRLVKRPEIAKIDKAACEADRQWMSWLYDLGSYKVGTVVREVLAEE